MYVVKKMTYREETYLVEQAIEMILRGMDVSEVQDYVYEQVGRNLYIYTDVWDRVMWVLEYDDSKFLF